MADFKDLFQSADWKSEKHVPVIEAPKKVKKFCCSNMEAPIMTVNTGIPYGGCMNGIEKEK